ncbi:transposase domain-containing protein [Microbulbifer epialgicus]|uniref:Transposase domain-containing protein n=1 Tax=Microbulbifer epialgicus TaxID=393907 RepID=A0ABV4P3N0_9GAMM
MQFNQVVEAIYFVTPEQFSTLFKVLSPELIEQCLQEFGAVTVPRRRLPVEMKI